MTKKERRIRGLQSQVFRLDQRLDDLQQISNRVSWARLGVFAVGFILTVISLFLLGQNFFWLCLSLFVLLFVITVIIHRRYDRSIARHRIWQQIKQEQIARASLDWAAMPPAMETDLRLTHPFEADLNIVGEYALHRVLNTTVTPEASQRLRTWLTTEVPDLPAIRTRQQIVRELLPLHLFRDKLLLNARFVEATARDSSQTEWQGDRILSWLQQHKPNQWFRTWLIPLVLLATLNLVLLLLDLFNLLGAFWPYTLAVYAILYLTQLQSLGDSFGEATTLHDHLERLGAVFGQMETFAYRNTPNLRELCSPFLSTERSPSTMLSRITRIVAATGIQRNPYLALPLNALVPWDFYFAYRLNQCKIEMVTQMPRWLETWYTVEALCSLANMGWLNPEYTFPEFSGPAEANPASPICHMQALGHPLIPDNEKVLNDFTANQLGDLALITGSNMAGKSTFLKALGINLALAYAGGPVDARQMQTEPMRLFTSIGISDSVTDGISYFYAEVKRLRQLLDELTKQESLPLFFCIDEIFRGTNNRERFLGSRAYIRELVGKHGMGLISTHDLELVHLADELPQVTNYHFKDTILGGKMVFDYKLYPGPCPTTNALIIMEMEGLPIE